MNLKIVWGAIIFFISYLIYLAITPVGTDIVLKEDNLVPKEDTVSFLELSTTTLEEIGTSTNFSEVQNSKIKGQN